MNVLTSILFGCYVTVTIIHISFNDGCCLDVFDLFTLDIHVQYFFCRYV